MIGDRWSLRGILRNWVFRNNPVSGRRRDFGFLFDGAIALNNSSKSKPVL